MRVERFRVKRSFLTCLSGLHRRLILECSIDTGKIVSDELEDLNQLCSDLKQEPFTAPRKLARRSVNETAVEAEAHG
jgi:hypothetical protein